MRRLHEIKVASSHREITSYAILFYKTQPMPTMLKGNNLNKIDTGLVLWISNVFHLGYVECTIASASAAPNTEVLKFI